MDIKQAVELILNSKYTVAFTGAGISVESGIPTYREEDGLWEKYDSDSLDINSYKTNPDDSWIVIKELVFDFFGKAKPNIAHKVLAQLESKKLLKSIITQNVDNLHQQAGSKNVFEFHGNSRQFICLECGNKESVESLNLTDTPPECSECGGLHKPDFIFFGEKIHLDVYSSSQDEARSSELMIITGTTGEIPPASSLPYIAKQWGAKIIEINTQKSAFTNTITDVFLQGKATEVMSKIALAISKNKCNEITKQVKND